MRVGLHQGCELLPLIFGIVVDVVMKDAREGADHGMKFCTLMIGC